MKNNYYHLENVTTPRVVWVSKTRNHSVHVTTSVVWVSETMKTQEKKKKNTLRNLSTYQTGGLQQQLLQHQLHHRRESGERRMGGPLSNPGNSWTGAPCPSPDPYSHMMLQYSSNLCLLFMLEFTGILTHPPPCLAGRAATQSVDADGLNVTCSGARE